MTQTKFYYQTPDSLLPPASFEAEFWMEEVPGGLQTRVKQIFTNREEIPAEELEAEGFSASDDFSWEGILPPVWKEEWMRNLAQENWLSEETAQRIFFQMEGKTGFFFPSHEEKWTLFAEELIQACLEIAGRELPMEMVLGRLEKSNFYESARIQWLFTERSVVLELPRQDQLSWEEPYWKSSREQVREWVEKAAEKEDLYQLPKSKGWFWLLNGEAWLAYIPGQKGEIWEILSKKVPGLT
jgi:hypothetical protein